MKLKLLLLSLSVSLLVSCGHYDSYYGVSGSFGNGYYGGNPIYSAATGFNYGGRYYNQPFYYVPASGVCVAYINNQYRQINTPSHFKPKSHYPAHNAHNRPGQGYNQYVNHKPDRNPSHANNAGHGHQKPHANRPDSSRPNNNIHNRPGQNHGSSANSPSRPGSNHGSKPGFSSNKGNDKHGGTGIGTRPGGGSKPSNTVSQSRPSFSPSGNNPGRQSSFNRQPSGGNKSSGSSSSSSSKKSSR